MQVLVRIQVPQPHLECLQQTKNFYGKRQNGILLYIAGLIQW